MECKKERNLKNCNCTYDPCARQGDCCACLQFHLQSRELPACCFSRDAESTFDRSFAHFARLVDQEKI